MESHLVVHQGQAGKQGEGDKEYKGTRDNVALVWDTMIGQLYQEKDFYWAKHKAGGSVVILMEISTLLLWLPS